MLCSKSDNEMLVWTTLNVYLGRVWRAGQCFATPLLQQCTDFFPPVNCALPGRISGKAKWVPAQGSPQSGASTVMSREPLG